MDSAAGQRSYWERHARNCDGSMRLLGGPLPRVLELTAAALSGTERVLEVAAGTGIFTEVIAKHARAVVATDYAGAVVEQLRRRMATSGLTNVDCRQADLYALDLEPASFDVVVAANVLHLLPDLPAAIAVLREMLKPHGLLLAPTYCHDQTWGSRCVSRLLAPTGFPGQRRFTMDSLTQALEREALRVSRRELVAGIIPIAYVEARRV